MAYLFIVVLVDGFQGAPVNGEGRKAGIVAAGRQVVDTDVDAQAAPLVLLFVRDFYIVDQLDDDPVFVWDQAGLLEGAEVFPLCESRGDFPRYLSLCSLQSLRLANHDFQFRSRIRRVCCADCAVGMAA